VAHMGTRMTVTVRHELDLLGSPAPPVGAG
jgi:hypothetical protein